MGEGKKLLYFCSAEEDSLYTIRLMQRRRKEGGLSEREERLLSFMENRDEEGRIYLAPAVIYAAANQKSCENWFHKAGEEKQKEWYQRGVAWMRRYPAFLETFGWKERRKAILTAGILALAESGNEWGPVCGLLQAGWKLLWEKMEFACALDARGWKEAMMPWRDSRGMNCAMAGILLLMAALLKKPVYDRDQLWRDFQKLREFSLRSLEKPRGSTIMREEFPFTEDDRMEWLTSHFKNPQRLTYVREKGRIDSDWLNQLFRIMKMAGLPVSACETLSLSGGEVRQILEAMDGRMSAKNYMTFLTLYTVAKELAQAGRAAAAAEAKRGELEEFS